MVRSIDSTSLQLQPKRVYNTARCRVLIAIAWFTGCRYGRLQLSIISFLSLLHSLLLFPPFPLPSSTFPYGISFKSSYEVGRCKLPSSSGRSRPLNGADAFLARDSIICYSALYAIARPSVYHTGGSVKDG